MKNPRISRMIGYVILFIGFILFYKGFHFSTIEDPVNGKNPILIVIAVLLIILSFVWMLLKVRCPHCKKLLYLRLRNLDKCPHCGRDTDSEVIEREKYLQE